MPRMNLYSAESTESPPYFSISGKMLQTPRDSLFLRRLMAVTTSASVTSGYGGSDGRWGGGRGSSASTSGAMGEVAVNS